MLGASFLPTRFRNDHSRGSTSNPGYLNQKITPLLQSVSRRAFIHPIRTIVFVALLASTSYVGLLEGSFFDGTDLAGDVVGGTDFNALMESGSRVRLGPETSWEWKTGSEELNTTAAQQLVLATLVFPDSKPARFQRGAPSVNRISIGKAKPVRALTSIGELIPPVAQDTHLAFSVPVNEAVNFLNLVQELPTAEDASSDLPEDLPRTASWVMKVARNGTKPPQNTIRWWASNAWTNFVDLLMVRPRPWPNKEIGSQKAGSTQNHLTSSSWSLVIYPCISRSSPYSCQ